MQKRIEVPVWLLLFSAILHLLTVVGLVTMLVVPTLSPLHQVVTVVEIRVTATPEPTMTSLPPTATVIRPTATPVLPTGTMSPSLTPTSCGQGGTAGIDCPLTVSGLSVTVGSLERQSNFVDGSGQVWEPNGPDEEFLTIHLIFPAGTVKSDLNVWFVEDMGILAPQLVDDQGNAKRYSFAYAEDSTTQNVFGVAVVYVVAKNAKRLTLLFTDGGAAVDLTLVPGW